jgi:hypothetical protein
VGQHGQARGLLAVALVAVSVLAGCSRGSDDRPARRGTTGTGASGAGAARAGAPDATASGARATATGPAGGALRYDPQLAAQFTRRVATECARLVESFGSIGPGFAAQAARYDAAAAAMHAVASPTPADERVIAFVDAQAAWLHAMATSGPAGAGPPPIAPPAASMCRRAGAQAAARR